MFLKIRQERIKKEWTQEYVAQKVNISKQMIHDIETNRRKPSYEVLVRLEDLFKLNHRKLFAVVNDEPTISPHNNSTRERKTQGG